MSSIKSDELYLEELINRVTNDNSHQNIELVIDKICYLVKSNDILAKKCVEIIKTNIQLKNEPLVLKTLDLLEDCMSKCGPAFQKKIAGYKFLNVFTRLVSENYDGRQTSKVIRIRIVDLLLLWTTLYPRLENINNIKTIYESLSKERGNFHQQNIPPTDAYYMRSNAFMSDEEEKILRHLLQSSNKNDVKSANLLIQFVVKRDAKLNEKKTIIHTKLEEIKNATSILNDVMNNCNKDQEGGTNSESTLILLRDLHDTCNKFVPEIALYPDLIEEHDETTLADTIEVNEILLDVLKKCNSIISNVKLINSPTEAATNKNPQEECANTSNDLLFGNEIHPSTSTAPAPQNSLLELNEIFMNVPEQDKCKSPDAQEQELESPINNIEQSEEEINVNPSGKSLNEIDKISEDLLKANVKNGKLLRNFKKESKKVSLNELAKEKASQSEEDLSSPETMRLSNDQLTPFDKLINEIENENIIANGNAIIPLSAAEFLEQPILSIAHNLPEESCTKPNDLKDDAKENRTDCEKSRTECTKYLSEIYINLEDIQAAKETPPRKMLNNSDLNVTIYFTLNKPSLHVCALVISTVNQSTLPLQDYHLDASVQRPCKLRILPPTSTELPGVEPLRLPTVDIRQILLLYNPTKQPVDITFLMEYTLGNDPDPIKEATVVTNIPYNYE